MSAVLYLEDFQPGQVFGSATYAVTPENIKEFAGQWDPQMFHLDEDGAKDSFFQGLAASGWHTACVTMRLLITGEFRPVNGVIGAGVEELKWARPVRAGDVLTVRAEVLEVRAMRSRPGFGIVRVRVDTLDAEAKVVQTFTSPLVVQARG
ncbi:MAG TPA: MaoC family dehydratase [Magnetospirillum sp.]|jgi:acyl dehydratase|nr:MaoC family dehydratase [Magnetospirillum sp.]